MVNIRQNGSVWKQRPHGVEFLADLAYHVDGYEITVTCAPLMRLPDEGNLFSLLGRKILQILNNPVKKQMVQAIQTFLESLPIICFELYGTFPVFIFYFLPQTHGFFFSAGRAEDIQKSASHKGSLAADSMQGLIKLPVKASDCVGGPFFFRGFRKGFIIQGVQAVEADGR